jgi:hypothetical protein
VCEFPCLNKEKVLEHVFDCH